MDSKLLSDLLARSESQTLDFKLEPYDFSGATREEEKRKRAEFAKDVLAMANTPREKPAYIAIGAKRRPDGTMELKGVQTHIDDNTLQQQLEGIISPHPRFHYIQVEMNGQQFGVIEILPDRKIGPILPQLDTVGSGSMRRNVLYWRRGSQNAEASPVEQNAIHHWFHEAHGLRRRWLGVSIVCILIFCAIVFRSGRPEPLPPVFRISGTRLDLSDAKEGAISVERIQSRMHWILEISNANSFSISVKANLQFPEPVLDIKSRQKSEAEPLWTRQPLSVPDTSGHVTLGIEPFASSELTGLWTVTIDAIAAKSSAKLDILSTIGKDGGIFFETATSDSFLKTTASATPWFIVSTYRSDSIPDFRPKELVIPITINREKRSIALLPPLPNNSSANLVELRQGQGFRIPGIFNTRGYIVMAINGNRTFLGLPQIESTNQIASLFIGLASPPGEPSAKPSEAVVILRTIDGTKFSIGL